MAADLFESYAVTLVAALILGQVFFGAVGMVFPLTVAAIGVIASVVGILASNPGKNDASGLAPINRGFFTSAVVDRKSTRLNSSHANISYAVFCLKKKKISRSNSYREAN